MTTITTKLKGINKVKKKLASTGKVALFYYHRPTGTRLPDDPNSDEFLLAYKAANGPAPRATGTVAALIAEYLRSPRFLKTRKNKPRPESTKKEYRRLLARCEEEFGTMPIAALATPRVIGKFIDWQEEIGMDHPREADNRLVLLSTVFNYCKTKGRIMRNPLEGFARLHFADRSEIIWLEADIEKFMTGAPVELQRAMILALLLGQRYADLIRLRWADFDGTHIALKQRKTGARVKVKATAALLRMLDKTTKVGPYILTRADGRPWFTAGNDKALSRAWREWMIVAGLYRDDYFAEARNDPGLLGQRLRFHDIRGTSVTMLANAGCTTAQIVSITGHTLASADAILEKYLARTSTLSDAAIFQFENSQATDFANRLQTSAAG